MIPRPTSPWFFKGGQSEPNLGRAPMGNTQNIAADPSACFCFETRYLAGGHFFATVVGVDRSAWTDTAYTLTIGAKQLSAELPEERRRRDGHLPGLLPGADDRRRRRRRHQRGPVSRFGVWPLNHRPMSTTAFTRNYTDHSNQEGFQFEFFCDKCGSGVRSAFVLSKLGMAADLVSAASRIFGGMYGAAAASNQMKDMLRGPAWDQAFAAAITGAAWLQPVHPLRPLALPRGVLEPRPQPVRELRPRVAARGGRGPGPDRGGTGQDQDCGGGPDRRLRRHGPPLSRILPALWRGHGRWQVLRGVRPGGGRGEVREVRRQGLPGRQVLRRMWDAPVTRRASQPASNGAKPPSGSSIAQLLIS